MDSPKHDVQVRRFLCRNRTVQIRNLILDILPYMEHNTTCMMLSIHAAHNMHDLKKSTNLNKMRKIHEQAPYPPSSATDLYIALHQFLCQISKFAARAGIVKKLSILYMT